MNLNTFGTIIPFNRENIGDQRVLTGPGTDRPVGFTQNRMAELYWGVREFETNISVFTFPDAFQAFIRSQSETGSMGTAVGLTIGLSAAEQSLRERGGNIYGKTTILFGHHNVKNREEDGKPVTSGARREVIGIQKKVNEGVICGAGPIHKVSKINGSLTIDFSNIIFHKRLYWPKITISFGWAFVSYTVFERNGRINFLHDFRQISGGVFFGGGFIPLYTQELPRFQYISPLAIGYIRSSLSCCSRFYYDGEEGDKKRMEDCPDCKKLMGVE